MTCGKDICMKNIEIKFAIVGSLFLSTFSEKMDFRFFFYPTAIKGCRSILFTHGVLMGRLVGGQKS